MSSMRDPIESLVSDAQSAAKAEDERKRLQRTEDFKWLMAHAQGRRIVTFLLELAGVHRTSFHSSGSVMAFNEGRRDLGVRLEAEVLAASPDQFVKLLREFSR